MPLLFACIIIRVSLDGAFFITNIFVTCICMYIKIIDNFKVKILVTRAMFIKF